MVEAKQTLNHLTMWTSHTKTGLAAASVDLFLWVTLILELSVSFHYHISITIYTYRMLWKAAQMTDQVTFTVKEVRLVGGTQFKPVGFLVLLQISTSLGMRCISDMVLLKMTPIICSKLSQTLWLKTTHYLSILEIKR